MSSADAQLTYTKKGTAMEPVDTQEMFAHQFDLSQPEKAMSSYQKCVSTRLHTKYLQTRI